MKKTVGVFAHVDAGKTTFCEQILFNTNSIKNRGRVDDKNSFLDNHEIEKQRGITIFSDQGKFTYNNSQYYLIDTPGHIDFSPEMERSISIIDYAVIVISSVEKIQSHTKTVFRLLKKNNIPTFLFLNKIDREGCDIDGLIEDIKISLSDNVISLSDNLIIENGDIDLSNELIEFIAENDENILEMYFNDKYEKDVWISSLIENIKKCNIYPILTGSALKDIGIKEFLEKFDYLTETYYNNEEDFLGKIYKVKYDNSKNRVTYIKVISGKLEVKDEIKYLKEEKEIIEKINGIRIYNGIKFENINEVYSGDVCALIGLNEASVGDYLFDSSLQFENIKRKFKNKEKFEMAPTLKSKVIYSKDLNIKEVINIFKILTQEEPSLNVIWNETLREIHIHVMGKIQLEVLKELIKRRFNIYINFDKCEILYKETIKNSTIGYGHFEPLGHYSEVHLKLEPLNANEGVKFKSIAHVDELSIGHQNLVKTHIFEKEHKGILGGFPITDIEITLITGRAHKKHTSGGDFREATFRALRQGLEQVENELLEPYYRFKIEIDSNYLGKVMSDIQKLHGEFEDPLIKQDLCIVEGIGPVSTFMDYPLELLSFTKGNSNISFVFDGYRPCHNTEEVLSLKGYVKDSDIEYTSNSIFCSKGQGYVVKGSEAKDYMHCLK